MPTRASNGLSSFRMRPLGTARIRGSLGDKTQGLRRLQVSKAAGRLPGSLIALEGGPWYGDFSPQLPPPFDLGTRSAERRVGKGCVRTCRTRCSPYHEQKKKQH